MAWQLPHYAQNIRLRTLRRGDLSEFLAYRSDPLVARYQGWSPMSEHQAMAFLERESSFTEVLPGAWSQLGIATLKDDQLIGDVGLWLSDDATTAEFGISLSRGVQGHGFGTEAAVALIALIFASTSVETIVANTDQRNEPCRRALLRAGMAQVRSRTETCKSEVCTEHCFRVTRDNGAVRS